MKVKLVLVLVYLLEQVFSLKNDAFTEELLVKPLFSEQLYVHFQFATIWDIDVGNKNCKYF